MIRLIYLILLSSFISGCATPVVIDSGNGIKIFTPCTTDDLCARDAYGVAWDDWYFGSLRDYPVSYRTKQFEYESNKAEFILLPTSMTHRTGR